MKTQSLLAGVLLALSVVSPAFGIAITSTEYTISGNWQETDGGTVTTGEFFSSSTNGGVLGKNVVSGPRGRSSAQGSIDSFNLEMDGYSAAWGGMLSGPEPGSITMAATATTLFRTTADQITINLRGNAYYNYDAEDQDMEVFLWDVTTDRILFSRLRLDDPDVNNGNGDFDETSTLEVDASHEFRLVLSGSFSAFDAKMINMEAHVGIQEQLSPAPSSTAVPDGGASVLMLGLGLLGLCGLHNHANA